VGDLFCCSTLTIEKIPNSQTLSLWISGGQDGQCIYWLSLENGVIQVTDTRHKFTYPLVFNETGTEMLISGGFNISRFSFPDKYLPENFWTKEGGYNAVSFNEVIWRKSSITFFNQVILFIIICSFTQ